MFKPNEKELKKEDLEQNALGPSATNDTNTEPLPDWLEGFTPSDYVAETEYADDEPIEIDVNSLLWTQLKDIVCNYGYDDPFRITEEEFIIVISKFLTDLIGKAYIYRKNVHQGEYLDDGDVLECR